MDDVLDLGYGDKLTYYQARGSINTEQCEKTRCHRLKGAAAFRTAAPWYR